MKHEWIIEQTDNNEFWFTQGDLSIKIELSGYTPLGMSEVINLLFAAPELLEALIGYHEFLLPTDTYCEQCDSHAPKEPNKLGIEYEPVIGILPHKPDCPRAEAEAAIAKATP